MKIDTIEHKGEKIYLKKDWTGWRTVEPIFDPETKKFKWKGFLNKKGFVTLLFLIIILLSCYLAFKEQIENYQTVMENPCKICESYISNTKENSNSNSLGGELEIDLAGFIKENG